MCTCRRVDHDVSLVVVFSASQPNCREGNVLTLTAPNNTQTHIKHGEVLVLTPFCSLASLCFPCLSPCTSKRGAAVILRQISELPNINVSGSIQFCKMSSRSIQSKTRPGYSLSCPLNCSFSSRNHRSFHSQRVLLA